MSVIYNETKVFAPDAEHQALSNNLELHLISNSDIREEMESRSKQGTDLTREQFGAVADQFIDFLALQYEGYLDTSEQQQKFIQNVSRAGVTGKTTEIWRTRPEIYRRIRKSASRYIAVADLGQPTFVMRPLINTVTNLTPEQVIKRTTEGRTLLNGVGLYAYTLDTVQCGGRSFPLHGVVLQQTYCSVGLVRHHSGSVHLLPHLQRDLGVIWDRESREILKVDQTEMMNRLADAWIQAYKNSIHPYKAGSPGAGKHS